MSAAVGASDVLVVGGALLGFALVSRRLTGTAVTPPMVFVAVGLVVGPSALGLLHLDIGSGGLRLLAEATLALVLFTDASRLDSRRLARDRTLPVALLAVALPLTILVGGLLAALLVPGLAVFEALALAVLLAPTDAALGQTVVSDERIPLVVREALGVESGLNDGICVPLLIGALSIAELEEAPAFSGQILRDLVVELVVAVVAGVVIGLLVGALTRAALRHGWVEGTWLRVVPLVGAAAGYVATTALGGSGFIGAFVAGLAYGRVLGPDTERSTEAGDEVGSYLSAVTFLVFGAAVVPYALARLDGWTVLYAVLSLTVVRMLPVALVTARVGAGPGTQAFVGWFGPRGLATVVFGLTVVEDFDLPGTETIVTVAAVTVLLSVLAHGLTAPALTARYVGWLGTHRDRLVSAAGPEPGAAAEQ